MISLNGSLFISLAFQEILEYLPYDQQVPLQHLNKKFYYFIMPRYLQYSTMTVRPTFIFFDFSDL